MRALWTLTSANLRSFVRQRAALFWTLAFPLTFVVLFGSIFDRGGEVRYRVGLVDADGTPASATVADAFRSVPVLDVSSGTEDEELAAMREGERRAVIVIPAGFGEALGAAATSGASGAAGASGDARIVLYSDPSQQSTSQIVGQIVGQVVTEIDRRLTGRSPILTVETRSIQAEDLRYIDYVVPSILAMAIMQLGIFSAVLLVEQREKLILKRLGATPLRRSTLVASNILMRVLIGLVQAALIVGAGRLLFDVRLVGNLALAAGLVVLGALTFTSIGYAIASFAQTEEAATALTSVVQFPLMFLSGIFFPIQEMPDWLRTVATAMPLTYLGDALRQTMVGATPFAPVAVSVVVLLGWLVASFAISARFFRWH